MNTEALLRQFGPRETMECDVLIVGAGPAGLASAIRLKQLAQAQDCDINVYVLEKGSEPGAHILSGAIMDPRALTELFPNWKDLGAPLHQPVNVDEVLFLSQDKAYKTPNWLMPRCFVNHGNYIVSLEDVTKWLAQQAEALGVEIFPGFAGAEVLYNEAGAVRGVATGNMGVQKDGQPGGDFQLGMELLAKYTLLAEGARGNLGRTVIAHFGLDSGKDAQSYGLGIKELWEIPTDQAQPGLVLHTAGWPMDAHTYGGGFLYHLAENKVALGFVTGLDYTNPYCSPFEEMQRWKTHPAIAVHINNGKRLGYGARAIAAGGLNALPKTIFPGGALIGCDAGYLNAARIKGSHAAIKSGMLAAEATFAALKAGHSGDELDEYPEAFAQSWLYTELKQARNFKPWFKKGNRIGALMTGVEHWLLPKLGIHSPPWSIHNRTPDHAKLKPAAQCQPIQYPKPDGKISFDRLSSVYLSNTNHNENQPAHLTLKDAQTPNKVNWLLYVGPEARYCPAGVYEFVPDEDGQQHLLQINAQNCVHCKTCDIKDPTQNIVWVPPEGGGGPNYAGM